FGIPPSGPLARFRDDAKLLSPTFGLAPNGTELVLLGGLKGTPHVITVADGKDRPIPVAGALQTVAWGRDPDHFLAAGINIDAISFGILEVGLDGSRKLIWSSATDWFGAILAAPETPVVAGTARLVRQELLLLDPVRD